MYDNGGSLAISLYSSARARFPYIIRYHNFSPFPSATSPLVYNEFKLDYESFTKDDTLEIQLSINSHLELALR